MLHLRILSARQLPMKCTHCGLFLLVFVLNMPRCSGPMDSSEPVFLGVEVTGVKTGSSAQRAGLKVGDVLFKWRFGTEPAGEGNLQSPFQLRELEIEQAARGPLVLRGSRNNQARDWQLLPGKWGLEARPQLQAREEDVFWESLQDGDDGHHDAELFRAMGERYSLAAPHTACWFYLQAAKRDPDQALALRQSAFDIACRLEGSKLSTHILMASADPQDLEQALTLHRATDPDSLWVAWLANELGKTKYRSGQWEQARTLWQEARMLWQKLAPDSYALATNLNNLGLLALEDGDLPMAHEYLQQALTYKRRCIPDSPGLLSTLANLGIVYKQEGNLAQAEHCFREGLALASDLGLEHPDILINWGNLANHRKDLDTAMHYYLRAEAILAKRGDQYGLAEIYNNLGTVAEEKGRDEEARTYFEKALGLIRVMNTEPKELARCLNNYGQLLLKTKKVQDAWAILQEAHDLLAADHVGSVVFAYTLRLLGRAAERRGTYQQAAVFYRRGRVILENYLPDSLDLAANLYAEGRLAATMGKQQEAILFFEASLDALENQVELLGGSADMKMSFEAEHADYYRELADLHVQKGDLSAAFAVLERSRARYMRTMLAQREELWHSLLPETLRDQYREARLDTYQAGVQLMESTDNGEATGLRTALEQSRAHQAEIWSQMISEHPRLAELQLIPYLEMRQIRDKLETGTLLLSYLVSEKDSVLLAIPAWGDGDVTAFRLPRNRLALSAKIEGFRVTITRCKTRDDQLRELHIRAWELYQDLLAPARDLLKKSRRVLINPDGPLHGLPFSALVSEDPSHLPLGSAVAYLGAWKPVFYDWSATVYGHTQDRTIEDEFGTNSLVVFGDPANRGSEFEPLPWSRQEAREIAREVANAKVFLGMAASEEQVAQVAEEAEMLHFATHGVLNAAAPLDSGLVLAGADGNANRSRDGILRGWEIAANTKLRAHLVTLSACNTARGKEVGNEGLIGLTWAFRFAGAASVVASLWQVRDRATAQFMGHFYRHLRQGEGKAQALQSARRELIESGTYAHPFYWSGFVLSGDWR